MCPRFLDSRTSSLIMIWQWVCCLDSFQPKEIGRQLGETYKPVIGLRPVPRVRMELSGLLLSRAGLCCRDWRHTSPGNQCLSQKTFWRMRLQTCTVDRWLGSADTFLQTLQCSVSLRDAAAAGPGWEKAGFLLLYFIFCLECWHPTPRWREREAESSEKCAVMGIRVSCIFQE